MNEEDSHSVCVEIPKPRVHSIETANILKSKGTEQVTKKKLNTYTTDKFSLPVIKPLSIATIKRDEILLPYLVYSKKEEKYKFSQRLKIPIRESHQAIQADLQKRLHTNDPENDVRAVTDFDPGFFTCINGTFLSSYVAPFKSLKYLVNIQLRLRQEIGYRNDCMLNLETNYKKEQEVYNASTKRYMEQVKYLNDFVSHDYHKSMLSLSKWDEIKSEVYKQTYELQCLAAKVFTFTSQIVGLDYRYGLQQKYGRFLYYLSPPSWRLKNRNFARSIEIEARGFDFGISNEEDTFNVIFEKLKKECCSGLVKPVLYFEHPDDLMKIFDSIEQQHLHHFTHVVQIAPHATFLKKGIKLFKDIIFQDSAGIANTIENFKTLVQFSEDQCSQLESKFFKIMNGLFYKSVGALEVLKFQSHLEFCYEKIYNEKPINMDIVATAKALEDVYMDYSKRLEAVTVDKIKAAMAQYVESERRKFKRAKEAARELRLFERLERELIRAHAPTAKKQIGVPFINKQRGSRRKLFSKSKFEEHRSSLTEAEVEYLTLFTDWTEGEDPAKYLQRLSLTSEEKEHTK